ncbi:MAG TPA: hypothetical protein VM911_06750 [Pyrinomonadaceae bacterium]|jgi:hypothetical protein|nr:hypothetical protein [Pyrinomonadaceae bacterium]
MSKKPKDKHQEQTIRIALAERHWVMLLGLLNQFIVKSVGPEIEKLKKQGIQFEDIDDVQATVLGGPILVRGIIVKELVAKGVMRPEADERVGIDKIMGAVEDFKKRLEDGEV